MKASFYNKPPLKKWALYFGLFAILGFSLSMNPQYLNIARHEIVKSYETQLASTSEAAQKVDFEFSGVKFIVHFSRSAVDPNAQKTNFNVTKVETEGVASCSQCDKDLAEAIGKISGNYDSNGFQFLAKLSGVLQSAVSTYTRAKTPVVVSKSATPAAKKETDYQKAFSHLCEQINCESRNAEDLADELIKLSSNSKYFEDNLPEDISDKRSFIKNSGAALLGQIFSKHLSQKIYDLAQADKRLKDDIDLSERSKAYEILSKLGEELDANFGKFARLEAIKTNYRLSKSVLKSTAEDLRIAQSTLKEAPEERVRLSKLGDYDRVMEFNEKIANAEHVRVEAPTLLKETSRSFYNLNSKLQARLHGSGLEGQARAFSKDLVSAVSNLEKNKYELSASDFTKLTSPEPTAVENGDGTVTSTLVDGSKIVHDREVLSKTKLSNANNVILHRRSGRSLEGAAPAAPKGSSPRVEEKAKSQSATRPSGNRARN